MANFTQFEASREEPAALEVLHGGNGRHAEARHVPSGHAADEAEVFAGDRAQGPQSAAWEAGALESGVLEAGAREPGGRESAATVEDTYVFPASREQTRYWMLAQLDPESTASNMAIAFAIEGEVVDRVIEASIAALTMRHEALRTIFRLEGGVLSQVVLARPLYRFTIEDLTSIAPEEQAAALEASVSRHGHTVINLQSGPVLHAHLVHLTAGRHVMALTMNHIVCDGWSNGVLIRDFTVLYEAMLAGETPVLPELPFQFADFSLWQNEYLASPAAEEAAAFWKAHITSDLPALDLPTDHPRPSGRSFPGHIESALLPQGIDDKLKAYCRQTGSTKHIVLLAAFEALCARYTGQNEFLLGSTIANRTQPGMEDVVGRFANPQIIVAKVDGDPTFHELEQRVRDWETAAYTHQDLPFSRIIEDFQIDQAGATSQFLQVWFLYQKAFMQPQEGRTIRVTPRRSVSGGVDFDLLVSVVERAEGPRIQFEYNTLIFEPSRIRGMIDGLIELLGGALEQPGLPLSQVAHVLPPATVVLQPLAEGPASCSATSTIAVGILDKVAGFAAGRPDAIAATDAGRSISWSTVERQSSAVADYLRRHHPDVTSLFIHLSPRVESIVALLASIKLGIQIVPLPAQAEHGFVTAAMMGRMPPAGLLASKDFGRVPTLAFEDFASLEAGKEAAAPLQAELQAGQEFLFLTDTRTDTLTDSYRAVSGRTLDRKLASLLLTLQPSVHLAEDASILAFPAATAFDATLDLLLGLHSGAQMNLAVDAAAQPVASQVATHEVSCILATPRQVKAILSGGWRGDRRVSLVVHGDRCSASLTPVGSLRLKAAVYLLSSPATGGVAGIQYLLGERMAEGLLPLSGESLTLRNAEGLMLPAGAFGEVCCDTGLAVSRLDAVREVVQAGAQAGARGGEALTVTGRTGYMARSSPSGVIELHDRDERYIQLRGHRVCLGDIEDAAFGLPFIEDAAAVMIVAPDELVLYLSAPAGKQDTQAMERHLSQTLPSHLMPSYILWLDNFPLTAAGRLDMGRLPQREQVEMMAASAIDGLPLNRVEEKLAAIWKDVLGLRSLDIHRSFFALGGSSLLLVRLFARINKAFDTSLPITTIFDAQTVAALAVMLGGEAEMSHLVQVNNAGSKPPLFMIHSYLLYQGLSKSLGPEQPFYGLRELEQDGQLTIDERVAHYTREIRKVQPAGPYHLAGWCAAGPLTVEVARKLLDAGEEVRYLALFDSWLPGYLESIETANTDGSWHPYRTVGSKINYHRNRVRGLGLSKKARYLWLAVIRIARDTRYRIYLHNWERLHDLSEKYHFQLPQFMHNTSLETFSALKEYRGRKLPVKLTLIRASDSREVAGAGPSCGWDEVAEKGVDVVWAPGDHETMFIGKNLKVTSEIVQLGLEASGSLENAGTGDELPGVNPELGVLHVDCTSA